MRLILTLLILLVVCQSLCIAQTSDTTIQRIEKINQPRKKAFHYELAATWAWQTGQYEKTLEYTSRGLKIAEEKDFKDLQARLLNNRGIAYDYLGDYTSALSAYFKALRIQEKVDDQKVEARILSNIGLIYSNQQMPDKALAYHKKALKIHNEEQDLDGVSVSLNNIAIVYAMQKDYKKAIENYLECIRIDLLLGDDRGLADDYNNIGISYMDLKEYTKAMEYLQKALKLRKEHNNPLGVSETLTNIATVYFKQDKLETAKEYFIASLALSEEIGSKESLRYAYHNLYEIEEELNNTDAAFYYFKKYIAYRDSLQDIGQTRQQTELELNYHYEKEKELERIEQDRKEERFRLIIYSGLAVLVIILFFSALLYKRWKQTQGQKKIIEEKNRIVENKNREILDSINYARRIQVAILPSREYILNRLPKHFVIYEPKDIVAGDFYWLVSTLAGKTETSEVIDEANDTWLAVADCTGHGVPGALMSVVCHNALNRSLREFEMKNTADLLDKTREIIVDDLSKNDLQVNDGMDISLCRINHQSKQIEWSGANSSLLVFRMATNELEVVKGNKQPIGVYKELMPFTAQTIQLNSGDRVYLFTDGFADQFGGPLGKKLMSKRMKEWILKTSQLSLHEQRSYLMDQFNAWKGDQEQVDDVCLIGFEV
jgi:serine phosphatase RsbU (regulator of sigma subunit)/Tfp pilus assembly protein PilF